MSKLLWKCLLVSPAVWLATLVISVGAVRAAEKASSFVADSQTPTEGAQSQMAEVQTTQEPSIAIAPTETISELQTTQEVSPAAPAMPVASPTIAQVPPAAPTSTDVLNQINRYGREGNTNSEDQVTNVSQLRDVSPNDWAFEALRNLVERYGCIAGYPDGTYRGNRALTRYEFAAGLNACLQQIERLIGETGDVVTREDFETLQRLVQEFEAELATLGTRVDNLEGRVAFLEDNQFSTTTKLSGEAIFALTDEFGTEFENNTVFQDRVRLTFNTSFTGTDRLATRLAAGNADAENQFTINDEGFGASYADTQTFNIISPGGNDVVLDWLAYYFTFGSSKIYLAATGGIHSDYAPTLNPYFEDYDGGNGALSTFASESPIYRIGGGAGAAISLGVGPLESILGPSTLTVGYLAGPSANDPSQKNGLFDGDYAALAQLNFNLGDRIGIGATYVHGYHNTESNIFDLGFGDRPVVGTSFANRPGGVVGADTPVVTNSYGVEVAFRLTDNISISGFGAYTDAILINRGDAEIWTYGAGVALSDLGKEGNILGIFGGVQPYLGSASAPGENFRRGDSDDLPYHIEAFYKYQVTDNISVTPGVIWLINPNQGIGDDDDALIGTLRTTFTF